MVSIIVPCYNQAEFLADVLNSVISQTYSDWECIVVDDGSPDNTTEVAAQFTSRDQRISVVTKKNGGLSDARNFGILRSKGKYILPLDADDRIGPDYLKLAVEALEKDPSLRVVYPKAEYFGALQGPWHISYTGYIDLLLSNSIYCTAMYRRSDYDRVGGYDTSLKTGFEDWEFWIRLLENDNPAHSWVYQIPEVYFYYRVKENSMVKDLVKSKQVEGLAINFIVAKHIDIYTRYFGGITHYIREHRRYEANETKVRSGLVSKLFWWISRKIAGAK